MKSTANHPLHGICLTLSVLILGFSAANAQAWDDDHVDPADTSSPRGTLKSFISACNRVHNLIRSQRFFDRTSTKHHALATKILDCLDVSQLPEFERLETAGEAAVCIKEILDRVTIPEESEIPGVEDLSKDGKELQRWRIPGTRLTISRVEEGPQRHEYVTSIPRHVNILEAGLITHAV